MVHNVLRVPTVLLAYTLMILMITNGINGENLLDKIYKIVVNSENEIKLINDNNNIRCPESKGYFFAPGTGQSQCLKVIYDTLSWKDAAARCKADTSVRAEGLVLARPYNARALNMYLFERYGGHKSGYYHNYWVNARGDSSTNEMTWQEDRCGSEVVFNDSPLWGVGEPGNTASNPDYCMVMAVTPSVLKRQPDQVYYSRKCTDKTKISVLCELNRFPLCQ